jgi:chorismate-pyruvate lyase
MSAERPVVRFNGGVTLRLSLESALGQTGATVTAFLEELVGEPVDAHQRCHVMIEAGTPNLLGVASGHPLLQRSTVLQGRRSAKTYAHAASLLDPARLPGAFCHQLETSDDPIGRILTKEGISFTRFQLPGPGELRVAEFAGTKPPEDYVFARTYRVDIDGMAVMVISEWFLPEIELYLGPS